MEGQRVGRAMEGVEQTKVKYTSAGIHWNTPLNLNLDINNERQECKIGTVVGVLVGGRVNEGDLGEEICLVDFMYLYEIEQWNLLQLL
jgi:hypothetical protein